MQLARRVHEFIAQAQVYRQPLRGPPVVLAVEAIGVVEEKAVFIGKGRRKLDHGGYVLEEIRQLVVLELPIKGVGILSSFIEPVEQYAKLEGMFPSGPIHVVAQGVDVLNAEGRGGGIDRPELANRRRRRSPAHVDYAGGKTRHELRTQTIILGQAIVK